MHRVMNCTHRAITAVTSCDSCCNIARCNSTPRDNIAQRHCAARTRRCNARQTSLTVMYALRAQSAIELDPDISLASHTSVRRVRLVAHALAPQVEIEYLEGMQQQNISWTRHQVVCIVFKEIVQLNFMARNLCS